jgi:hypothetical protein
MSEIKTDNNNEILINAVKKLQLRFPVADIQRATGYEKGSISSFLNNKKPVSDNFLQTFSEAFKIDLREFGYTKGLTRLVEKENPPPIKDEGLKDKMIALLEKSLKRVEAELERALEENKRLNKQ